MGSWSGSWIDRESHLKERRSRPRESSPSLSFLWHRRRHNTEESPSSFRESSIVVGFHRFSNGEDERRQRRRRDNRETRRSWWVGIVDLTVKRTEDGGEVDSINRVVDRLRRKREQEKKREIKWEKKMKKKQRFFSLTRGRKHHLNSVPKIIPNQRSIISFSFILHLIKWAYFIKDSLKHQRYSWFYRVTERYFN